MCIGLKIKQLASEEKITLADLAKRLEKTKQAIYEMVEKDDVNTAILRKLCNEFKVPISYFFDEDVPPSKEVRQSSHGDNSPNVYGDGNQVNVPPHGDTERLQERIRHLEEMVAEKEKMISEKERVIRLYETVMGKK